jgi:hypothetical protein
VSPRNVQPHLPTLAPALAPDEREFQRAVLELLELLGYRAVHHRPLRTRHGWATGLQGAGSKGWPDILAVRTRPELAGRHRIIAIELKGACGRVEPDQRAWLGLLAAAGVEVHIWRSGTDSLQQIAEVLR